MNIQFLVFNLGRGKVSEGTIRDAADGCASCLTYVLAVSDGTMFEKVRSAMRRHRGYLYATICKPSRKAPRIARRGIAALLKTDTTLSGKR
jgi:hypothetical protein